MYYNLQLVYENCLHYYRESAIETRTIYESAFNSYVIYHPAKDKELNMSIVSSILEVCKSDMRDSINGYVIDICLVKDKLEVNMINQKNVFEKLVKIPVDQVKDLGETIFEEIRNVQYKNKWLVHQDFLTDFYSKVGKYITYEGTCCNSSLSLKYVGCSKKTTAIEAKIIEAAQLFLSVQATSYMSKHGQDNCHCVSIELERKSTHPIITGKIHDYLGNYKYITINLKNIKNKNKVKCILKELEKDYELIYNQAEKFLKRRYREQEA